MSISSEQRFQDVRRTWDLEVKVKGQLETQLGPETKILDVLDMPAVAGRLLIIGKIGAGKTTSLLEVAKELIERARTNHEEPMPYIINLASWKEGVSFYTWMQTEVKLKYGVRIRQFDKWLQEDILFPLLDGLDELEPQNQMKCISAINDFLSSEAQTTKLLVCCRSEDYKTHTANPLNLNGAVFLRPLTNAQISEYLVKIGLGSLWRSIRDSKTILDIVSSPLFLSMLALAYKQISFDEWKDCNTPVRCKEYLLSVYINYMLSKELGSNILTNKNLLEIKRKHRWLVFLAQRLNRNDRKFFSVEQLQPYWLDTSSQRIIYRLITTLIAGIILTFILFSLTGVLKAFLISILVWFFQTPYEIEPIPSFHISWKKLFKMTQKTILNYFKVNIILCTLFVLMINILTGKDDLFSLIISPLIGIILGSAITILFGIFPGFMSGLFSSFQYSRIGSEISMGRVSIRTILNSGVFGFCVAFSFGITLSLFLGPSFGIVVGSLIGAVIFLVGSRSLIQILSLRIVLRSYGLAPLYYLDFLNDLSRKMILKRVGNNFSFIHSSLLEHLAKNPILYRKENTVILPKRNVKRRLHIILPLFLLYFTKSFILEARYIPVVNNMNPLYNINDRILVDKATYNFFSPKRGDIILFRSERVYDIRPQNGEKSFFVRRIIGLPGESVEIRDGSLYVNSHFWEEPYSINSNIDFSVNVEKVVIPKSSYLVLGDDRVQEKGVYLEIVSTERILGKSIFRFWPPNRLRKLW